MTLLYLLHFQYLLNILLQIHTKLEHFSEHDAVSGTILQENGLKELNEVWSNDIQNYETCKKAVLELIKKVRILEKEKMTKETLVTKMEVFEKRWTEVTRKVKLISSVQQETNKLWNANQELKESLNKDVEALKLQLSSSNSSIENRQQQELPQVKTELTSLTNLKQKVEKTKDLLNVNSLALYSAIAKVTHTKCESEELITQVHMTLVILLHK